MTNQREPSAAAYHHQNVGHVPLHSHCWIGKHDYETSNRGGRRVPTHTHSMFYKGQAIQGGWGGWPTGNGNKLSNSQACCLAQLCLAAVYILSISCRPSTPSALYSLLSPMHRSPDCWTWGRNHVPMVQTAMTMGMSRITDRSLFSTDHTH